MSEDISVAAIASRLTTRWVGQQLEVYDEIDSTNIRAIALANAGAPAGTLVLAEQQTQGRGRLGRQWIAPHGSSLLMSLLLRPALAVYQAPRVTMLCSLAIVEAIAQVARLEARVKWPNDVIIHGKKVAGLLTEAGTQAQKLTYLVIGMGINVNFDPGALPGLLTPATSLAAEAGHPIPLLELLLDTLQHVETLYNRLQEGWSPHEEWRKHLATLGQQVRVGTREEVIEGLVEDVDADGALLIREDDGSVRRVLAGDVTLRGHRIS